MQNSKDDNYTQILTTILAYALPVLQFCFSLLTSKGNGIFLFTDYFFVVSIFTAILSYILILTFASNPYFNWAPFQKKRIYKNSLWKTYTDRSLYDVETIKTYESKHKLPKQVSYINGANVVTKLFVPILILSFVIFFAIGVANVIGLIDKNFKYIYGALLIIQSIAYATVIIISALSFANQFLQDMGIKRTRRSNSGEFDKTVSLVRARNGFEEFKSINLIRQFKQLDPWSHVHSIFYFKVDQLYYVVVADKEIDIIEAISKFDTADEAETFINTPVGATE